MSVQGTPPRGTNNLQSIQFSSPEEEIAFLRQKLAEAQTEFLEFQESSHELETEFETQIKQLEDKNNQYSTRLSKLEIENDQLKSKYAVYTNDTQHKLNEYQEQLAELQALNTRLTSYIRELEQNNDDLERARRTLTASLEDFEAKLNQQIERNVLLENEVNEKEELECVVQRLKDETRDLKFELNAHSRQNDSARRKQLILENHRASMQADSSLQPVSLVEKNSNDGMTSPQVSATLSNGHRESKETVSSPERQPQTPSLFLFTPETPHSRLTDPSTHKSTETKSQQTSAEPSPSKSSILTPSSRISALNIVNELLRKVVSLESKLSTAKKVTN